METDHSPEAVKRRRLYRRLRRNVRLGKGFLWFLPLLYGLLCAVMWFDGPKPPPNDPVSMLRHLPEGEGEGEGEGEWVAEWLEKTFGQEEGGRSKTQASPIKNPRPLGAWFWILDLFLILASLGLAGYARRHPRPAFQIAPWLVAPFLLYLLLWPPDLSRWDRVFLTGMAFGIAVSSRASAGFLKKMSDLESRFPREQLVLKRRHP